MRSVTDNPVTYPLRPRGKAGVTMTKLRLNVAGTEVEFEGNERFLSTKVLPLLEAVKKSHNQEVKNTLREVCGDLQQGLATLDGCSASISHLTGELSRIMEEFSQKSTHLLEEIRTRAGTRAALMVATTQLQEMEQSFNLQYLMLQQEMQQESQQFTTVSNVMKTKHDTAKDAINNIR